MQSDVISWVDSSHKNEGCFQTWTGNCSCLIVYVSATNTSFLTDSCIVFTLKMKSVSKNTFLGQKMILKSGLEKVILKSLHAGRLLSFYWICDFGHFYEVRKKYVLSRTEEFQKYFFYTIFHHRFLAKNFIHRYRFHFEGENDVWISQLRHIKSFCF
jgi:hypothetical protein